ncbi:class I SAM-dependent methyltransferase [Acidiphilium acidophilum]|uniref:Methyltransferase domain-containing protein n=1 Tax=Acidiphilium acidophilum TaxID=76588 RepID=A0AAW9DM13_ACIAO|nr:hypothetical protein [Acidiphilium acidophilum]MDX5929693.1 hypothetical protein [Acidiphilium acidophilum]
MSGFTKEWLDLREPVDAQARDKSLLHAANELLTGPNPLVVDLGCGIGSTVRAFGAARGTIRWRLLDHDPVLIDHAAQEFPDAQVIRSDLRDITALPLAGATLVTASALFDLCSGAFISELTERIIRMAMPLYAALTFNGIILWQVPHPLDTEVVTQFNIHQRRDKGFGPAEGANAASVLDVSFTRSGYHVVCAPSNWVLNAGHANLQAEFIKGVYRAVKETGTIGSAQLREWRNDRLSEVTKDGCCIVGHIDCLAVPV